MDKKELREIRKKKFTIMKRQPDEIHPKAENRLFYHHSNEIMPTILMSSYLRDGKDAWKLAAISLVAAGHVGDMPEELCNELLDDIDYQFNKVKCRKIELMMPKLMKRWW